MAKPGITPDAGMRRRPRTTQISMRSAVHHIAGPEQPYPVYPFSQRIFVEKPNANPFSDIPTNLITAPEDLDQLAAFYDPQNPYYQVNRGGFQLELDLAGWQQTGGGVARSAAFDPFGQLAWDLRRAPSSNGTVKIRQDVRGLDIGGQYTYSWHVAPGADFDWVLLGIESSSHAPAVSVYFDIRNRVAGTASATVDASGIVLLPNGWSRIWLQYTQTGTDVNHRPQLRIAEADNDADISFGGNTFMYIAKPQFNQGGLIDYDVS